MPFSGYLKIPDIDGESIRSSSDWDSLSKDTQNLITAFDRQAGNVPDLKFDLWAFKAAPDSHSPRSEELALNFAKITFDIVAEGDGSVKEVTDFANKLADVLGVKAVVTPDSGEGDGAYKIALFDVAHTLPDNGGNPHDLANLTDLSGFHFG